MHLAQPVETVLGPAAKCHPRACARGPAKAQHSARARSPAPRPQPRPGPGIFDPAWASFGLMRSEPLIFIRRSSARFARSKTDVHGRIRNPSSFFTSFSLSSPRRRLSLPLSPRTRWPERSVVAPPWRPSPVHACGWIHSRRRRAAPQWCSLRPLTRCGGVALNPRSLRRRRGSPR